MAESSGVAVKLFGKTILVRLQGDLTAAPAEEGEGGAAVLVEEVGGKESPSWERRDVKQATSPSTVDQEAAPAKCPKPEEAEHGGATCPPEKKNVRKPDIVLPCPRCHSMDTKFCYYNNYNLAQPRHFCRGCQRYWTVGGAMRNLPVGAGRRKSKHSSSYHRQVTVFEPSLQAVHPHPVMKPNGAVLCLSSGMPPLFDSMTTVLKLPEKTMGREHVDVVPHSGSRGAIENGEHSSGSSATAFNSAEGGCGTDPLGRAPQGSGENPPEAPSLNWAPWPYLCSSAPAFHPSSFPIPFYPTTAYWGCVVTDAWGVPCPAPPFSSSPSRDGPLGFAPSPPPLRQHLRDEDGLTRDDGEGRLCVPKTLRIDDPEVVAKSSVWAAMGLKCDKAGGISRGGLFMAFDQPKTETGKPSVETPLLLHANPAALSRSLNFQESL